jgi:PTH1 family peptidyl-tRNA hydrolase
VRIGVGRPEATDPRVVADYVLSRFSEPADQVSGLVERAREVAERVVLDAPPA